MCGGVATVSAVGLAIWTRCASRKTLNSLSWVAFCGRQGTADEVVQMWQYVQRIDGDVRDVVLRLDNRMAKIYGRTWK